MTAIKKDELERLEKKHGLEPGDLSYQHRCSRIAAYEAGNGDIWKVPERKDKVVEPEERPTQEPITKSALYGKRLLISPMMVPDAKRNLAFDEPLGPEITVRDFNAGESIYGAAEEVDRMVGDYEVVHVDKTKQVVAKTTFPKIGTEISWVMGKELVPVVRGNDGKRGYLWAFPTRIMPVEVEGPDGLELVYIQVYGLKALIQSVYPELLPEFKGAPMMQYIDGMTLAASIPMTEALIKKHRRQQLRDRAAGIDW